jgi:hypothetical protein
VEKAFGQFDTMSALIGLIWQVRDAATLACGGR